LSKPAKIAFQGRHEGRAGWRYAILGPTESGKTTMLARFVRVWLDTYREGKVIGNFKIYSGQIDEKTQKPILDPRWSPLKRFERIKYLKGTKIPILLAMDEFSKYINSLTGYTSGDILKMMIDLANNLTKQDVELAYSDQWPKGLHTRVRTNVNQVFLPTYEPEIGLIEYYVWPSIDHYLIRDEFTRKGPHKFLAKEWWPYFDTKEIISPKFPKFKPEYEAEYIQKWAVKNKEQIPTDQGLTDFLNFYMMKRNINWGRAQMGAVRHVLRTQLESKDNGKKPEE
jgi:hypothetical protein